MKILVVDDDQTMRDFWTDMLTALEHEVVTAKDGVEGVSVYRHGEFDFVVSDYQMPRMNGVLFLMEVRHINPAQKMLLASGDPPTMPTELAGVPVLLKGTIRLKDIESALAK
jgi:two-component system, cell cycle sensor histidine kinase and response regulator CckA